MATPNQGSQPITFKKLEILIPEDMMLEVSARAEEIGKDREIVAAYLIKYGLWMLRLIDDCKRREAQTDEENPPEPQHL